MAEERARAWAREHHAERGAGPEGGNMGQVHGTKVRQAKEKVSLRRNPGRRRRALDGSSMLIYHGN